MARKVFVSFDYENDKHYKFYEAWDTNPDFVSISVICHQMKYNHGVFQRLKLL